MIETDFQQNEMSEINVTRIIRTVLNKAWLVAIIAVLCAVLTFAGTFFLSHPSMNLLRYSM